MYSIVDCAVGGVTCTNTVASSAAIYLDCRSTSACTNVLTSSTTVYSSSHGYTLYPYINAQNKGSGTVTNTITTFQKVFVDCSYNTGATETCTTTISTSGNLDEFSLLDYEGSSV